MATVEIRTLSPMMTVPVRSLMTTRETESGVTLRVSMAAIRAGMLPTNAGGTATWMLPESWVRATLPTDALMDWATRVAVVKSGLFSARVSESVWFRLNGISRSTLAPWTTRPTVVKFF